jgi:hypothetical protein
MLSNYKLPCTHWVSSLLSLIHTEALARCQSWQRRPETVLTISFSGKKFGILQTVETVKESTGKAVTPG